MHHIFSVSKLRMKLHCSNMLAAVLRAEVWMYDDHVTTLNCSGEMMAWMRQQDTTRLQVPSSGMSRDKVGRHM